MADDPDRRSVLRSGVALCVGAVGGCLGIGDGDDGSDDAVAESDSDNGSTPPENETDPGGGENETDGSESGDGQSAGEDDSDSEDEQSGEDGSGQEGDGEEEPETVERWPMLQYDAQNTGAVPAPEIREPKRDWVFEMDPIIEDYPVINGRRLFVPDDQGTVHAINKDGEEIWTTTVTDDIIRGALALWDDLLLVPHTGAISALDTVTGTVEWEENVPRHPGDLTVADDEVVFGNGRGDQIRAHDPRTGELLWTFDDHNKDFRVAPAIDGDYAYYPDAHREIFKIDMETGEKFTAHRPQTYALESPVTVSDDWLFAGGPRGVWAYSPTESHLFQEEWHVTTSGPVETPLAVSDGLLFTMTDGDGVVTLYAINVEEGTIEWETLVDGGGRTVPIVAGDLVYYSDEGRYYRAAEKYTGERSWRFEAAGFGIDWSLATDERVFFVGTDGIIEAVSGISH